jgi:hypothetical protein
VRAAEFEGFWDVRRSYGVLTEEPPSDEELSRGPRTIVLSEEFDFSIAVVMALEKSIGTLTSGLTGVKAHLTDALSRSCVRTRTKFFHGSTRRKTGSFERAVKYHSKAMFAVFAEADFSTGT